jgi:hypothetical protein
MFGRQAFSVLEVRITIFIRVGFVEGIRPPAVFYIQQLSKAQ